MTNDNAIGGTAMVNPPTSGLKHSLRSATRAKEEQLEEATLIREEDKIMEEHDEEITSEEDSEIADNAEKVERSMLTVALVSVETRKMSDDAEDPTDPKHRYGLRKRRRQSGEDLRRLEHFQSTTEGGLARVPKRPEPDDQPDHCDDVESTVMVESKSEALSPPPQVLDAPKVETKPDHPKVEIKPDDSKMEIQPDHPKVEIQPDDPKVKLKGDDPVVETKVDAPIVETKVDAPIVETKVDAPIVETKVDAPIVETMVEQATVETMVEQATVETMVEQATVETMVEQATVETMVEQVTVEAMVEQMVEPAKVTPTPEPPKVETMVEQAKVASKPEPPKVIRKASDASRDSLPQPVSTSSVPNPLSRSILPPSILLPNTKAPKPVVLNSVPGPTILPANVPCPLPAAVFEDPTPAEEEACDVATDSCDRRKVTINETVRSRGFSIDMDSLLDMPDDSSAAHGGSRDRAFSFECFAFGINADEPLPPLEQSASSSHGADTESYSGRPRGDSISFSGRPRGDSIIFDPVSFQDGGIHEQTALERARSQSLEFPESAPSAAVQHPGAMHPGAMHPGALIGQVPVMVPSLSKVVPYPAPSANPAVRIALTTTTNVTTVTTTSTSTGSFSLDLLNKDGRIGIYLPDARRARISRFHAKRAKRIWRKRIKYDCRKKLADSRPRIKGRFVKRSDMDED